MMPIKLRRICNILCSFIFLILLSCQPTPDAQDSQGRPIYLSEYHGKWMVVNYWATWCKPCLSELPELNAFYIQHANKVIVLGVNFDALPNTEIEKFARPLQLKFPLLQKFPIEKFGVKDIPSLPATFLIDPKGHLHRTLYGPQTVDSLNRAVIKLDK
jgi:thiol-disulfide isomerase/thioredoxin